MLDPKINQKDTTNSTNNSGDEISAGIKWLIRLGIAAVLGLAFAWYKFIVFSRKKRLREAKDDFAKVVNRLKGTIDKNNVVWFYDSTKEDLRIAVLNFEHVLETKEKSDLKVLWASYENIDRENHLNQIKEGDLKAMEHLVGVFVDFPKNRLPKPSEILSESYDRFLKMTE